LRTTKASQSSPIAQSTKPNRPISRGEKRQKRRTISIAAKKTVRLKGSIAMAVAIGVRPCTIWM
jgi:hypothetical protein